MNKRTNTKSFWDDKDYRRWEAPGPRADPLPWATFRFLDDLLPTLAGKTVLDLGCGPGTITPYLAGAADRVVGLDFSEKATAAARKRCAEFGNVTFVVGDILDLDLGTRFDGVVGRMFLHEVMHEDTPRLLERLHGLLADGGFLYFHENSYFNPIARFIRRHLVGRYGIPKHGSENELPFDRARFEMYCSSFSYCERFVDGVEFIQKLYHYFSPFESERIGRAVLSADRGLSSFQAWSGLLNNWSYTQTIYASRTTPRSEVFGDAGPPRTEGRKTG